MLDVGFSEILLTSAIALIVLGPERLPKVARQVGNWMGRARAMARQLSEQLEREVSAEELLKTQSKPSRAPDTAYMAPLPPDPVLHAPVTAAPNTATYNTAPPVSAAPDNATTAPAEQAAPEAAPAPASAESYGLDASLTTPAAMHAYDPPAADAQPAQHDNKSP